MINKKIIKWIGLFLLLNITLFMISFIILTPYIKVLSGMQMQQNKEKQNEIKYKGYILNSKKLINKEDIILDTKNNKEINNKEK